ncbi:hypothetical protein Tco_1107663 [Tanacetum coccineum]
MMSFLTAVVTSWYPTANNQLRTSSRQQATIYDGKVIVQPVQGRQTTYAAGTTRKYTPGASGSNTRKQRTMLSRRSSRNGLDALTEVHNPDNLAYDLINQSEQIMTSSEQSNDETVHNFNSSAQQHALILSMFEQLNTQVMNCTNVNLEYKSANKALTTELDRYKEDVKDLKEMQNVENSFSGSNEYEHAYWKATSVPPLDPSPSSTTNKVKVPKEFPKVSMVNTSLKELKCHLAGFDQVVKERTTATAITEGTWGFEHTKACFRDEIIPFIKELKDIFNNFNQYLVDELVDVQNVFYQMEQAKQQHHTESRTSSKMNQKNSILDQNAPSFTQLFELSELRAQSQEKDTIIVKLKEKIKSLKGNVNDSKVKMDMDKIETFNIELEHRVTKLVAENEHLKQTYKQLYDSIKPKCVQSKEQSDALVKQVNIKSGEISDLNVKLQEQGLVLAALKNELRKLKGKALDKEAIKTHSVDPKVSKDNVEPITPKLYTKVIQELLSNISRTCPSINNFDPQLVAVTPRKKDKKVRFAESLTSTENTKTDSTSNIVSNKRVLHSTGVRLSTSASGSQPSGNTRNDKIQQTPSSNSKNKVEAHPRNIKSSLNKRNGTVKVNGSASVQNSKKHDNSDYVCINGDDCMSSDNLCVSNSMRIKPTGRTFTIVGNACPLTRITTTNEVPSRKPIVLESESPKPVVNLVYSRKPRKNKNTESLSKTEVVQIVLWYLDSGCSKHMTGDRSQLTNFISKFLGTVKFGNDQVAKIMGYGDYQIGNVTISRVYYIEGLGHNLFSVGQFCDSNLEVAFRQHTCFIRIKRHGLVRGLPKLKFEKDHLCSACALGKSSKKPHKPKSEDTNQEKLYLLHMDLCGPMRVASVNGKKYILELKKMIKVIFGVINRIGRLSLGDCMKLVEFAY